MLALSCSTYGFLPGVCVIVVDTREQCAIFYIVAVVKVVVDAMDPSVIVSIRSSKTFDFGSVKESELTKQHAD